jgi:orotidine-5'-phosphate decarboxylase
LYALRRTAIGLIDDKYDRRAVAANTLLCVGLDSALDKLPARFRDEPEPQFSFNRWVIDRTHEYTAAYKPNTAFYEARGDQGLRELKRTVDYLRDEHPDIVTICDAKRGDNATTNAHYLEGIFDWLGFDAVTLSPYLGRRSLQPFLERADRGCIILTRTSNPGDGELQDLMVDRKPLWQVVTERIRDDWNANDNCMLLVGATRPEELRLTREIVPELTLLVPGVGVQGGSGENAVELGTNSAGRGLLVSASRSVIFADDPAAAAKALRDEINAAR